MSRNKLIKFIKYLLIVLLTFAVSFTVFYYLFFGSSRYAKLRMIDTYVSNYFYGDYDEKTVDDDIFSAYMSALDDKYAAYYDADAANEKSDNEQGQYHGLGITVTKYPDSQLIFVDKVYENGPADTAGVRSGDIITAINGEDVETAGYSKSVDLLQGQLDQKVTLTVLRSDKKYDYELTYGECEIQSVYFSKLDNIGYIQITTFNEATVAQFKNAVNSLTLQPLDGIIFDLRNNGGGTVNSVCEILDFLMPQGVLMSVEYADGTKKTVWESDADQLDLPMAVLTNGSTASASELFSANVRDFNKGVLIGEKTYGKGVMQQTFPLVDGSAIKMTVAEYFPHSSNNFDGVGLEPDIEVTLSDEQEKYFYQLSYDQDPQITAAKEWFYEN